MKIGSKFALALLASVWMTACAYGIDYDVADDVVAQTVGKDVRKYLNRRAKAGRLTVGGVSLYRSTATRDLRAVEGAAPSRLTGPGARVIDLDAATPRHEFLGLGVSFPESSCHLLMKLPAARRRAVLEQVFGKDGLALSIGRIHCGASDYSRHLYSYDDVAGDVALEHFSIDDDRAEVLPVVREALAVNPDLFFFSSPWSPPGWMKTNGSMCGGSLRAEMVPVYARYLAKFLAAYAREGVRIGAYTVQNEPETAQDSNSPTCRMPAETEIALVRATDAAVKEAGLAAKPWCFDHNFKGTNRVAACLADASFRALLGGVAWHPYAGCPEMIAPLRERYPDLPMHVTEMGPHVERLRRDIFWWGRLVLRSLNAGCGSFASWCLALDEDGQPNISLGFPCAGLVEIHSETGAVTPSEQYRLFRHISPYVRRGARILDAPVAIGPALPPRKPRMEDVDFALFRNPDGSHVAVFVYTPANPFARLQVQVKRRGEYLPVQLLAGSVTTLVWR